MSDAPSLRESLPAVPESWLNSGGYLPDFMRDFHDQKDLFKALDEVAQRSIAKGNPYIEGVSWSSAHVYTVDIFLWALAKRGYTLQRSRKRFKFYDIGEFVGAAMQRWRDQSAAALGLSQIVSAELSK